MARQGRGLLVTALGATLGAVAGGFVGQLWMVEFRTSTRTALGCVAEDGWAFCESWQHAVIRAILWGAFLGSSTGGLLGLKARGYGHLGRTTPAIFVFIGLFILAWARAVLQFEDGDGYVLSTALLLPLVAAGARAIASK